MVRADRLLARTSAHRAPLKATLTDVAGGETGTGELLDGGAAVVGAGVVVIVVVGTAVVVNTGVKFAQLDVMLVTFFMGIGTSLHMSAMHACVKFDVFPSLTHNWY